MGEGLCGGVRWEGLCGGARNDGRHGRERRGGREVGLCPPVMFSVSLHRCWAGRPVGQE